MSNKWCFYYLIGFLVSDRWNVLGLERYLWSACVTIICKESIP